MGSHAEFMQRAIELSAIAVQSGSGGPFGAVIVRGDSVIATGHNQVIATADPTAHAEVQAIRAASRTLSDHRLSGCVLYASCEPCPMCLGAIYWARIDRVYYANTRIEAAAAGFDDALFYDDMARPPRERQLILEHFPLASAGEPMTAWQAKADRTNY
jgi:guanine deaminase